MKRSEMLEAIKVQTDNLLVNPMEEHEIEWILDIAEKAGMKPPIYSKKQCWTDKAPGQVIYYRDVNEWEKE